MSNFNPRLHMLHEGNVQMKLKRLRKGDVAKTLCAKITGSEGNTFVGREKCENHICITSTKNCFKQFYGK